MIYVFISALLFGLVHPISKILLSTGIDLISFCTLYVMIRLIFQVPVIFKLRLYRLNSRNSIKWLATIGIVGAALQLTEFVGIARGLPVPIVTMIVYSHPFWSIFLSKIINKEKFNVKNLVRIAIGLCGLGLIIGVEITASHGTLYDYFWPLVAGFCISLWISLSKGARNSGISTWTISFYYDLFAFLILIFLKSFKPVLGYETSINILDWISFKRNFSLMIVYSLFVGLIPNLLFYYGSRFVSAISSGLILLLEPIIASLLSVAIWHYKLPITFWIGSVLVLSVNLDIGVSKKTKLILKFIKGKLNPLKSSAFILIFFVTYSATATAAEHTIYLNQFITIDHYDYTVSTELHQIAIGADIGLQTASKIYPKCHIRLQKQLGFGDEQEAIKKLKSLTEAAKESDSMLVGFSRSNFARVVAKLFSNTPERGISIGASTEQLTLLNKNFLSIVSPWRDQWKAILAIMKSQNCKKTNTQGFFTPTDHISSLFNEVFSKEFGVEASNDLNRLTNAAASHCIFIGTSFSAAQEGVAGIIQNGTEAKVFGIGDWGYYSSELKNLISLKHNSKATFYIPTGWKPDITSRTRSFVNRFQILTKEVPSPVAAYTHDAILAASGILCNNLKSTRDISKYIRYLPFLRKYRGISQSGNFESPMYVDIIKPGEN